MSDPGTSPASPKDEKPPREALFQPARVKLMAGLFLVTAVPPILIVYLLFGNAAASTAIFGVLVGMVTMLTTTHGTAVGASFFLVLLSPVSVVAGLSPLASAALIGFACLAIGVSAGWGLQRGLVMLPLAMAYLMISPPSLFDLPPDRISTSYLLAVMAIMAIGTVIPLVVLRFLLRNRTIPKLDRNTLADTVEYSVIISILTAIAMFAVLAYNPGPDSFWLILTLIVVVQVGPQATYKKTFARALGTVVGGAVATVVVVLIPNSTVLFIIGMLALLAALNFIGGTRYWLYSACITPTIILTSGASMATNVAEARVGYTLVGALLAALAFGIAHFVRRYGKSTPQPILTTKP